MAIAEPPSRLEEAARRAAERGDDADVDAAGLAATAGAEGPPGVAEPATDVDENPLRHTIAVLCPTVAAVALVAGIFSGVSPRVYAVLAAILGGLLAYTGQRFKNAFLSNLMVVLGIFVVGLLPAILEGGPGALGNLGSLLSHAAAQAHLVRPPVSLTPGFAALLGWISAAVGFAAVWAAVVIRRPAIAMLLPLPVAAVAAISVPKGEQIIDGLVVVALFGIGLGILSGDRRSSGEAGLPLAYELRRAAKAVPVLGAVVGLMLVLALNTTFLFPHPAIDPTLQAQRPKTAPLSSVPDTDLFDVKSSVTGPWVVGALDVYDGNDWLLPAFSDSQLNDLPASGVINSQFKPDVVATFTIRNQTGAVLPGLPNMCCINASGPRLNYDAHSGNIRLVEGEISNGFSYRVGAAGVPDIASLQKIKTFPADVQKYTQMPAMPAPVKSLIDQAPNTSPWDRFDFLRKWVLANVIADGLGTPVSIPPSRAAQVISDKKGSPYEIVATQVMLARWAGVPARIGYGFDGGTKVGDHLEVHPKDGTAFPEVFFTGHGWIPVIGTPQHAQASENSDPRFQQITPGVLPAPDIAVPLFLPAILPADSTFLDQLRSGVLTAVVVIVVLALLYFSFPRLHKAVVRARRRASSRAGGPRARIVQAYAEWRDVLTDLGYQYPSDTPIMLLRHFPDDEEHAELAWLVTRALWGDLQSTVDDDLAADADELSKTLRRRVMQAQPITVRVVAGMSRLSLRHPYSRDELASSSRSGRKHDVAA
jgi:hypothetical protein